MRLLLDTNVLLWTLAGHPRVEHLQARIVDDDNDVYASVASFWEVAIKADIGKLDVDVVELRQAARDSGWIELPVLGIHTEHLARLPLLHRDPFDRLLVAQAHAEPMRLLTSDSLLAGYGGTIEIV